MGSLNQEINKKNQMIKKMIKREYIPLNYNYYKKN